MNTHKALAFTGTTILCLWPAVLAAQEGEPTMILDGNVEVGAGYLSEDSFKFGEYTGLVDEGAFFIGNFDAIARDAYNDDSTFYLEMQGRNLGLENRAFGLEGGSQGRFGATLNYSQIPHYRQQGALTPYSGEGTNNLALPPTWPDVGDAGAPSNSGDVTAILPVANMRQIDLVNRRERFGGGLFWRPGQNWRFDVDYRNERKSGTQTTFGMFGENGGNPLSVALAEPTEYETNEVDAIANYSSGALQFQASYNGSFFNDQYSSLAWHNAFTGGAVGFNPWTDIPDEGQMALPPDNHAHNFTLSGGYSLSPTTRLTGSLGYGIMLQDEDFLPYTINPALTPSPLPRNSLDGEINTLRADLGVSARPTSALDLSARYRFSDRQNETPRDQFAPVLNDVDNPSATVFRVNTPHSFTQNLANLDAGYRLGTYTRLSLGYEYDNMERTFSEREKTEEHTITGKVNSRLGDSLSGWMSYAYGWRDGDTYVGNAPYQDSHTGPGVAPGDFENHPELRKYNIANRTRNEIKAVANWMTSDAISMTFGANYAFDDYSDTTIGLTEGEDIGAMADLSYAASENVTTYAYYSYRQARFEQKGHQHALNPPTLNDLVDPGQRWTMDTTDRVHSLGAGLAWSGIADNVELTLDYAFSQAVTSYDAASGAEIGPAVDPPDIETDIHSVELAADYAVTDGVTVRFAYLFEYYDSADWALDGVGVDSINEVLWFGGGSPDYTAHVVGVSTVINF